MRSRFLVRLDSEIAACNPGENRDALILDRASYLARLGHIPEARAELVALRERRAGIPSARVSALAHIADGLCHYYTDMGPDARDRFLRAHAIARAASLEGVAGRAASWLALVQYGAYQFVQMAGSLEESFQLTPIGDTATLARSCLVVAQTAHLANRIDLALPWYRRTRLLAAETEDEATISALMHNMASIWATNARNSALGGAATADSSRQALAGTMSTFNFDGLVGLANLSVFTPLLQAQLCSIEGDHHQALDLYEQHLDSLNIKAVKGWQIWLLADKGWCQLRAGRPKAAQETLEAVKSRLGQDIHEDDRAAVLARLSGAHEMLGDTSTAQSLRVRASESWRIFADLQKAMLHAIESSSGAQRVAQQLP